MSDTPVYDAARFAVAEMVAYAESGFPEATLEQVVAMTSTEPENAAAVARRRAEGNCELLLAGAWEIRDELNEADLPQKYRMAVYKERLGVRKGKEAYELLEVRP